MITDSVAIDYITLTTYSKPAYDLAISEIIGMDIWLDCAMKQSKLMQYEGFRCDSLFFGEGVQGKEGWAHYIISVSGEKSGYVAPIVRGRGFSCTRIDLQLTLPYKGENMRTMTDHIRKAGKQSTMIDNPQKLHTVYVGSWHSARLHRIYIKPDGDGEKWLRLETRYKKPISEEVWKVYEDSPRDIIGILKGEARKLSIATSYLDRFREHMIGQERGIHLPRKVKDDDRTWAWIQTTVMPVLARFVHDHTYGDVMALQLLDLARSRGKND